MTEQQLEAPVDMDRQRVRRHRINVLKYSVQGRIDAVRNNRGRPPVRDLIEEFARAE